MSSRQRTPGVGVGGVQQHQHQHQHVLDYLKRMQSENPSFFYAIEGQESGNISTIFWADSSSRTNYIYFGDTVRFDASSYCVAAYNNQLPFATFTGLNHHAQPVLFGCALLLNQSHASFIWLLQTWLRAMSQNAPVSITIDPPDHRLIQLAVAQVLPQTRLRFCRWTIFKQTKEKLSHIYPVHPTFGIEFNNCVNEAESVEEFESSWGSILDKYYLMDNEWLQSMYNARHQWVPIYMRDIFFGELSTSNGNDAINSFFDGFVNASTTIQVLIKQYEKAITNWHEKELKADLDTTNSTPLLKTPSPMEKQAANLYTRTIFIKFQEELVETLANRATKTDDTGTVTTYRVAKFGEEHKAHLVRFNAFEMKSSCSCEMFEFSGLICRHVLSVFRAKNVLTLPSQYVLKRWTRNAKSGDKGALDESAPDFPSNSRESLTFRYNNLRQEAIKFVEEGAKSIHIYNVAVNALQEAAKKVAAVKKKNFGAIQGSNLENGGNIEMHQGEENQAANCQSTDEKEKKISELTAELECINHRCEVYRANLLTVLRDMEDQKLKLSVKVQNARLSLKE